MSDKPAWLQAKPLLTPAQQAKIDQRYRKRIQSLQAVDRGLGQLISTLKKNGQLDNTYIVFTSDNGFHLGNHRLPQGKQTAYEEDVHLPARRARPRRAEEREAQPHRRQRRPRADVRGARWRGRHPRSSTVARSRRCSARTRPR